MLVKVFMKTAGHNQEQTLLRSMKDGIEKMLMPATEIETRKLRSLNKELNLGLGVQYDYSDEYTDCDVAVMLGSWKPLRGSTHHQVRSDIKRRAKSFICIETPILNRTLEFSKCEYFRVGVNGFLNKDAYFGPDGDRDGNRLAQIGNLNFPGWHNANGDKIVIGMQLIGDASLRGMDINEWCMDTIHTLRLHTNRRIEVRMHPALSAKGLDSHNPLLQKLVYSGTDYSNVTFIDGKKIPLKQQLTNAHCLVTYSSGTAMDALCMGIPNITCDEGSFAWNVSETKLENVEKLLMTKGGNVQQHLNNLAWCQWSEQEMNSGVCWNHLKSGIQKYLETGLWQ